MMRGWKTHTHRLLLIFLPLPLYINISSSLPSRVFRLLFFFLKKRKMMMIWFLPPHYTLSWKPEKSKQFLPLLSFRILFLRTDKKKIELDSFHSCLFCSLSINFCFLIIIRLILIIIFLSLSRFHFIFPLLSLVFFASQLSYSLFIVKGICLPFIPASSLQTNCLEKENERKM